MPINGLNTLTITKTQKPAMICRSCCNVALLLPDHNPNGALLPFPLLRPGSSAD